MKLFDDHCKIQVLDHGYGQFIEARFPETWALFNKYK